jgi:hypothetical protein
MEIKVAGYAHERDLIYRPRSRRYLLRLHLEFTGLKTDNDITTYLTPDSETASITLTKDMYWKLKKDIKNSKGHQILLKNNLELIVE